MVVAKAPALLPPLLLGYATYCWSFPYSLSKSLSTCNQRDNSVITEMTAHWKKPASLLELSPRDSALSSSYRQWRLIKDIQSLCSQLIRVKSGPPGWANWAGASSAPPVLGVRC